MKTEKYRFYEIDLLRFVAASVVVLFHYTFRGNAADYMSQVSFPFLAGAFKYGYLGVDLFFIISGFVILLTAYNKNVIDFTLSRVVRLYPAYWFCVSLTALLIVCIGGERYHVNFRQYLANLTMLNGFLGVKFVDGVYWSLMVELKFYFLIFLVLAARQIKHIAAILGAWLAVSIFLCTQADYAAAKFFLFPEWSAYFIAGAVFYLIRREGLSLYKVTLVILSYGLALMCAIDNVKEVAYYYDTPFNSLVVVILVTSFFGVFSLIALGKTRFMNHRRFIYLGALTYPLYLIHQTVGFMLFNYFNEQINKYLLLVLIVALVLILSHFIHSLVESRLARLMENLLNKAKAYLLPSQLSSKASE